MQVRRSPLLLACIALPGSLAPQLGDYFPEAKLQEWAWPDNLPALAQGRALAGDVTGDRLPDGVLLSGGRPVVLYGPSVHRSTFAIDLEATDLALLPPSKPGSAHELLVVNAQGLWRLGSYDAGAFSQELLPFAQWAGATRVRVGDTDGDGSADLVGLSAGGDFLFLEGIDGPSPVPRTVVLDGVVIDFALLRWSGAKEAVAVLREDGFFVIDEQGTELYELRSAHTTGLLMPFGESALGFDRCALVSRVGGQHFVTVLDATKEEAPLALGSLEVISAAAADVDGDGSEDLYLVHGRSNQTLLLFDRSASGPTFSLGPGKSELIQVSTGVPPTDQTAWPMLHDFDLDGDPDVLLSIEAQNSLVLLEDARSDAAARQVAVLAGEYAFDLVSRQGELRLELEAPVELPFQATHFEATTWIQPDALNGGLEAAAAAVSHVLFPMDAAGRATTHLALAEPNVFIPDIYHLELRSVRVAPGGEIVECGTPAVHAFTTPSLLTHALESEFGQGLDIEVLVVGLQPGNVAHLRGQAGPNLASERTLAPKDVKIVHVPKIVLPPDPF